MAALSIREAAQAFRRASVDADEQIAAVLAERAEEFDDDLRGHGPGAGITPFDTGRLLTSGDTEVSSTGVTFSNDAAEPGRESYASFAHQSGDMTGGYARDVAERFDHYFGDSLATEIEDRTAKALRDAR